MDRRECLDEEGQNPFQVVCRILLVLSGRQVNTVVSNCSFSVSPELLSPQFVFQQFIGKYMQSGCTKLNVCLCEFAHKNNPPNGIKNIIACMYIVLSMTGMLAGQLHTYLHNRNVL